jgi:hypothetical protein
MGRTPIRTRQLPLLQRGFERSRLEEQLVATAYELAVPLCRRALPTLQRAQGDESRQDPLPIAQGGLSA